MQVDTYFCTKILETLSRIRHTPLPFCVHSSVCTYVCICGTGFFWTQFSFSQVRGLKPCPKPCPRPPKPCPGSPFPQVRGLGQGYSST